jgi:uncharacterized protein HemX
LKKFVDVNLLPGSEAMCAFTVNLIDFDNLSDRQKKELLKNLQKKRRTLQEQLRDANRSLKGVEKALGVMRKKAAKKSKRRAKKR